MSHLDLFAIPLYRTIIGAPTESEQAHIQGVAMTEGRSTALNSTNLHILDVIQLRELRGKVESGIAEYMDHLGVDMDKISTNTTTSTNTSTTSTTTATSTTTTSTSTSTSTPLPP